MAKASISCDADMTDDDDDEVDDEEDEDEAPLSADPECDRLISRSALPTPFVACVVAVDDTDEDEDGEEDRVAVTPFCGSRGDCISCPKVALGA